MSVELSVILVNYNGIQYLDACLKSIQQHLLEIDYEIILIDNNSQDESCTFIKENYPTICLIESRSNNGFGKGNNLAVQQAKGEYVLLLNIDTVLQDNLKPALDYVKTHKTVGALGINMLNGNKEYLQAVGQFPNLTNLFWMKRAFQFDDDFISGDFSKEIYEVDWLTGSFILMSKRIYDEIKGFDEDYFLYVEDVDFCKRIADLGYKRVFYSKQKYIHYVGFNKKKNPMLIKGYRLYIKKHFKGFYKYLCLGVLKINQSVKMIKGLF
ncbi:glycosyltransferase family 2 protein [Flavobacterium sp. NRK F10]|uniref:glycosyltransferase family 2 protein n=1 Tax=Flavobacterium sp. NRK F10 TaxID=2954931 RepID=UPI0020914B85|nr:glycosyltransferase family 2 protein [Flavobacterium sp. NRK F10]MCO6174794.1 glycosyltransferase family 2 protein [Flavobacterium sp. NRK F10]